MILKVKDPIGVWNYFDNIKRTRVEFFKNLSSIEIAENDEVFCDKNPENGNQELKKIILITTDNPIFSVICYANAECYLLNNNGGTIEKL